MELGRELKFFALHSVRPSKCPKFNTNRILGEQNLRPKVRNFCQNLNCDKMMYVIKYTLRVQFLIKDYTRHLRNKAILKLPWVY